MEHDPSMRSASAAAGRSGEAVGGGAPGLAVARRSARASEVALVVGFLLMIGGVPVVQTGLELLRGERVQFTDVVRQPLTARALRQYEGVLRERSWFQQWARPVVRRLGWVLLGEVGTQAVRGRGDWLFYRPDLRYLVEPDRAEAGGADWEWMEPGVRRTSREGVIEAITTFRDQLRERGIVLVVVPVPGKPAVYPERLTRREVGGVVSPTQELLEALERRGVATVDLAAVFWDMRRRGEGGALYLARDTHWTPRGAKAAAGAVAARLRALGVAPPSTKAFRTQAVSVGRRGDILEMLQIPGLREREGVEAVECEQVTDPVLGLMIPTASERPGTYRFPGGLAGVLVLGDSFSRIYQYREPATLGEALGSGLAEEGARAGGKRLLPGSAGFIAHLALALQSPVDAITSDGGASTEVRRRLSTNPEILEGKRVVVWEFVERDIALGRAGWEAVPLPARLD